MTETQVLAADVEVDEETGVPLEWEHDGGKFKVLGAEPVRSATGPVRVFFLAVVPVFDNFGPWPLSGRRSW